MKIQDRLERLTPEQRATLAARLSEAKRDRKNGALSVGEREEVIQPDRENRFEPYQMTELQQAYWLGRTDAYEMGNVASRAYLELECDELDPRRLERSVNKSVARHDILRAIVREDGKQQVLESVGHYELRVANLRAKSAPAIEEALDAIRQEMLHDMTPATEWPLFDIRVSLPEEKKGRIHLSFDLLIADAGSISILLRELASFYHNEAVGVAVPSLTFRDYVLGERALQNSEEYHQAQRYWTERLEDLPAAPELPLEKPPAAVVSPRFVRRTYLMNPANYSRLKRKASQANVTMTGVLLAALGQVLVQWSRRPQFTLNLPIFNRVPLHPEVNDVIGAFTSVVLLAIDGTGEESFELRARRIQGQLLKDLDHRAYDGVKVMRDLNQRGQSGRMPFVFTSLVDVGFNNAATELGKIVQSINQTAQVWMDVHVDEQDGGLLVKWDSVDELFPEGLPGDMIDAYRQLLDALASSAESWNQSRFDLIPGWQRRVIDASNSTSASFPETLIHTLFEEKAREQPGRPAVITENRVLTYGELDSFANRIGRHLQDLGSGPDTLVAIVMDQGWEQVAGVYGVLKSGAGYLPLHAESPGERLSQILQNAEASVVLTQRHLESSIAWPDDVTRLCVDDEAVWASYDEGPLLPVQTPDSIAYVIYTSGSTGTPKGVAIEHRSVLNRMTEINERFSINENDRVIDISALHHDLSVYDLFGTFWAGAALVLPSAQRRRDPAHWLEIMEAHGVTFWNSVPAFLEMLVEFCENEDVPCSSALEGLRAVILAGDWISVSLPDRLRKIAPGAEFVASGGPTETTVWDVWYAVDKVDSTWKSIPYGRPLRNSRYYVLNENLQACPVWVTGEFYIAGEGLARGYWRDEETTREKFVIHPQTGERLYRSGDTGRWLPDGNLEFVGRDDFQVKIRGYRIELGEVEAVMRQCPGICESVVVAFGENNSTRRLVGYVVPDSGNTEIGRGQSTGGQSYEPDLGEVLDDPIERMEFKARHVNLRRETGDSIQFKEERTPEQLRAAYQERQTFRQFGNDIIRRCEFGEFLGAVGGYQPDELPFAKYRYPSAGNLFPVQLYVHVKPGRIEGIGGGIYYFHPEDNRLEVLSPNAEISRNIHTANNQGIFDSAAFSLFFIAQLRANEPLYGSFARDFCLLEAGYMGQLLMSSAPNIGLGLCPIGSVDFDEIRSFFGLEDSHVLVHSMLGGAVQEELRNQYSLIRPEASGYDANPGAQSDDSASLPLEVRCRNYMAKHLPDYMIPASIVALDEIPLTANGKIDRAALPEPAEVARQSRPSDANGYDSALACKVSEVFGEVLGTPVGVHDSFFDRGGNSLRILQAHRKLGKILGKKATIADLFRLQTPKAIAEFVEGQASEDSPRSGEVDPRNRFRLPAKNGAKPNGSRSNGREVGRAKVDRSDIATGEPLEEISEPFWSGIRNRLYQLLALYAPGLATYRVRLHGKRGVRMGTNVMIGAGVILETAHPYLVAIGNNVEIGIRCVFIGHFRETTNQARREKRPTIVVEDNVFIGPGVTILPNVTIGEGSVIAAGSVVNESVPPHTVVQGNPARAVSRCKLPLVGNRYADFVASLEEVDEGVTEAECRVATKHVSRGF